MTKTSPPDADATPLRASRKTRVSVSLDVVLVQKLLAAMRDAFESTRLDDVRGYLGIESAFVMVMFVVFLSRLIFV